MRRDVAGRPTWAAVDLDALQGKYQPQLDDLAKQGAARFHFVDYASPSFVKVGKQTALQITLRNPGSFDKDSTISGAQVVEDFILSHLG